MAIMWQCALCRLTAGLPSAQSLPGQAVVAVAWQCRPRPPATASLQNIKHNIDTAILNLKQAD